MQLGIEELGLLLLSCLPLMAMDVGNHRLLVLMGIYISFGTLLPLDTAFHGKYPEGKLQEGIFISLTGMPEFVNTFRCVRPRKSDLFREIPFESFLSQTLYLEALVLSSISTKPPDR